MIVVAVTIVSLGYHYKRCLDQRPAAFKYKLKAGDHGKMTTSISYATLS